MGKVREALEGIREEGRKGLIPYMVAGYPSLQESMDMIVALQEHGAAAVEVGIPFSDPMADGPTIQKAHAQALERGVTPGSIMEALSQLKDTVDIPLVLMTYYNPVLRMGVENFAQRAKEAGIGGAILPDLPPEEAEGWIRYAREEGLDTVFLVAPNTPLERVKIIARVTSGFLYYLALKGVTGSVIGDMGEIERGLSQVREVTSLPTGVGFGISNPQEAALLAPWCNALIVGSSLLRALDEGGIEGLLELFESLKEGLLTPL